MKTRPDSRKGVAKLGLLALGLTTALIVAEIAVRILQPGVLAAAGKPLVTTDQERSAHAVRYQPDTSFTWRGHAGLVKEFEISTRWNSKGFNDDDHTFENPSNHFRILVLGDSFVEALEVPRDQSFHQILEKKLNNRHSGRTFEVIALGRAGNGARRNYLLLEQFGIQFAPDLVLMEFLPSNDVVDDSNDLRLQRDEQVLKYREASRLTHRPEIYRPPPDSVLRHSRFWMLAMQTYSNFKFKTFRNSLPREQQIPFQYFVYSASYPPPWKRAWKFTMDQIRRAKGLADSSGSGFLLIYFNEQFKLSNDHQNLLFKTYPAMQHFTWDFHHPLKIIDQFAKANRIPLFNLEQSMAQEYQRSRRPLHYEYDGHWNEEGHRVAAEMIFRYLLENRLVPG